MDPTVALTLFAELAKLSLEVVKLNLEAYTPEQRSRLAELHLKIMEWQIKDLAALRKLLKLDA